MVKDNRININEARYINDLLAKGFEIKASKQRLVRIVEQKLKKVRE